MVTPPKGGEEVEEKSDEGSERGLRDDQHGSPEFYTDRWGSDGNRWLSNSYYYIFLMVQTFSLRFRRERWILSQFNSTLSHH